MTYEDGKYTIYTSDNTKFRMTEEHFTEIMGEFLQQAEYGKQHWFDDNFSSHISDTHVDNAFTSYTIEEGEELVSLEYAQEQMREVIQSIQQDYYCIPVKYIKNKF